MPPYDALFALYNGSEATIDISSIYVTEDSCNPNNLNFATGRYESIIAMYRISAYTGGTTVGYSKYVTSSSNLPSQIAILKYPDSITKNGFIRYTSPAAQCVSVIADANAPVAGAYGKLSTNRQSASTIFNAKSGVSAFTSILIREGEGFSLFTSMEGGFRSAYFLRVVLEDTTSGANYSVVTEICEVGPDVPMFAVFNNTGSGVVLSIINIEMTPIGQRGAPTSADQFRLCWIEQATGVDECTPVAFDTTKVLPTGIKAYRSPVVSFDDRYNFPHSNQYITNYASYSTTAVTQELYYKNALRAYYKGHSVPITTAVPVIKKVNNVLWDSKGTGSSMFRLNPREGVAIMYGTQNAPLTTIQIAEMMYAKANYNFNIVFKVTETTASSGGAANYAFM
jgi:hypothetical protein